jgi:hypothetical protein
MAKKKKPKKDMQVAMLSPEDIVKGMRRSGGHAPVTGAEAVFKRKLKKKKKGPTFE